MLENPRKGWHGSFSLAGRNSAEKFNIIMHQKEIFSLENPKHYTSNFFEPDKPKKDFSNENNMSIYKQYTGDPKLPKMNFFLEKKMSSTTKHNNNKIKNKLTAKDISLSLSCRSTFKSPKKEDTDSYDKYRYHHYTEFRLKNNKDHIKDKKKPVVKYYPKKDRVQLKAIRGIKWVNVKGRGESIFNRKDIDEKDFYLSHQPIKLSSSNFVNMNLQTQRGFFAGNADVRIRSDKLYQPFSNSNTSKDNYFPLNRTSHFELSKSLQKSSIEINNNSASTPMMAIQSMNTPDFRKMISRDQANKNKHKRRPEEDEHYIIKPNYDYIQPRPINMVLYDKMNSKAIAIKQSIRETSKLNHNFFFNPTDTFNKTHRNTGANTPNLSRMTPRPHYTGPLPSYMYNLYNRAAGSMTTDKTLKMNNFSEGHFLKNTSFALKKSFNQLINKSKPISSSKQKMQSYSSSLLLFKYCSNDNDQGGVDGVTCKSNRSNKKTDSVELNKLSLP